jgi:hypothetical protein
MPRGQAARRVPAATVEGPLNCKGGSFRLRPGWGHTFLTSPRTECERTPRGRGYLRGGRPHFGPSSCQSSGRAPASICLQLAVVCRKMPKHHLAHSTGWWALPILIYRRAVRHGGLNGIHSQRVHLTASKPCYSNTYIN